MRLSKEGLLSSGGAAACAICCAVAFVPGSLFAVLGLSGAGFAEWGEQGLIIALLALGGVFLLRRWLKPVKQAVDQAGCGCAPATAGKTGNSCDAPASAKRGSLQTTAVTAN